MGGAGAPFNDLIGRPVRPVSVAGGGRQSETQTRGASRALPGNRAALPPPGGL